MSWIFVIAIVIGLYASVYLWNVFKFSRVTFFDGRFDTVDESEVSAHLKQDLTSAARYLIRRGFRFESWVRQGRIAQVLDHGSEGMLFYHPKLRSWALALTSDGTFDLSWILLLLAKDANGRLHATAIADHAPEYRNIKGFTFNPVLTLSPDRQLAHHLKALQTTEIVELLQADALSGFDVTCFTGQIMNGDLKPAKGGYRYSFFSAWKYLRSIAQLQRAIKKLARTEKNHFSHRANKGNGDGSLLTTEMRAYESYKQSSTARQSSWLVKTVMLCLSVVVFAAAFGAVFSPWFAVLLVVVLLIHETGHLLAMWAFGYKDLSMLFIPFFGALASGRKEKIRPWQEATVLIMGPLPGYVLGVFLLQSGWDLPGWAYEFALIAIILNLINLLPFHPLDGGRLVSLALFSRLPAVQFVVYIISIGFFLGLWLLVDEPLGLLVAIVLTLGVSAAWRELGFMRHVLKARKTGNIDEQSPDFLIGCLVEHPGWFSSPLTTRLGLVDSLKYKLQHADITRTASVGVFAMWLFAIALPPVLTLSPTDWQMASALLQLDNYDDLSLEAWNDELSRFDNAQSDEERVSAAVQLAGMWYLDEFEDPSGVRNAAYFFDYARANLDAVARFYSPADIFNQSITLQQLCAVYAHPCESEYIDRAVTAAEQFNITDETSLYMLISLLSYSEIDLARRFALLEKAKAFVPETDQAGYQLMLYGQEANMREELGDLSGAETLLRESLQLAEQLGGDYIESLNSERRNLAAFLWRTQGAEAALDYLNTLISPCGRIVQESYLNYTPAYMASWLLAPNQPQQALALIERIDTVEADNAAELLLARIFLNRQLGRATSSLESELKRSLQVATVYDPGDTVFWKISGFALGDVNAEIMIFEPESGWYSALNTNLDLTDLLDLPAEYTTYLAMD